jgi:NADH dehydrogenase
VLRLTFFLRFMPSRRKAAQVVGDVARHAAYGRSAPRQALAEPAVAELATAQPA